MLAQNFMTAADLGLTDEQHSALIKTLALMDAGKLVHVRDVEWDSTKDEDVFSGHFNMSFWTAPHSCGTAGCIGGTAEMISGVKFPDLLTEKLKVLFYPSRACEIADIDYEDITVPQAAMALRSYLTTGDARWDLALADQDSRAHENGARQHG